MKKFLLLFLLAKVNIGLSQTFLKEKELQKHNDSILYKKDKKSFYKTVTYSPEYVVTIGNFKSTDSNNLKNLNPSLIITKKIEIILIPRDILEFLVIGISGYIDDGIKNVLYSKRGEDPFGKISNVSIKGVKNSIEYYAVSFIKWYEVEDLFKNYQTLTVGGDCDCDIAANIHMFLFSDGSEIKIKFVVWPKDLYLDCGAIFCDGWGGIGDLIKVFFEILGKPLFDKSATLINHAGIKDKINNLINDIREQTKISNDYFKTTFLDYDISDFAFTAEGLKATLTYKIQIN